MIRVHRKILTIPGIGLLLVAGVSVRGADSPSVHHPGLEYWPPAERSAQLTFEDALLAAVDRGQLRRWHDNLASEPHDAGSPGDHRLAEYIADSFASMGLEVERHEIHVYLAKPVSAVLRIVDPEPMILPVTERALPEDPHTSDPRLNPGWNAFSGSGSLTAEVVYANYGTREDFRKLKDLGVDCRGKIVVARYGRNYRGFKAKFAEQAGAGGLIIFSDPADSGYGRGIPYPEGGYANETSIQRGSIKTLPYNGDPLTPFIESTRSARRLDPETLDLPRIPVQPIGWGAAHEILSRMTGASVPKGWQGGLPFRYRLTGGSQLRIHLAVEQKREVMKTYNIIGTLRGATDPEQQVIIGCHHDAWGFGAGDPTAGLITVMESARVFSAAASQGLRAARSVSFAAWGAEEYGIIGSVEWVEANLPDLKTNAVAYINVDMAAMGPRFGSSSWPTLQRMIADSASRVPAVSSTVASTSVIEEWIPRGTHASDPTLPGFGDLGGGSDHVGFVALAGVPSASLGAGGSPGTSYHSNYDTLAWYRQVVGDDYESARMVTQMAAVTLCRLANGPLLPIDTTRYGPETRRHLETVTRLGREAGIFDTLDAPIAPELAAIDQAAHSYLELAQRVQGSLMAAQSAGQLNDVQRHTINRLLMHIDRAWIDSAGLPNRPWVQNLYAATDEHSGYAAWMLPGLRHVVDNNDRPRLTAIVERYLRVFKRLTNVQQQIENQLPHPEPRP